FAGESLGIVDVPCDGGLLSNGLIRVAVTRAIGAELYAAAVRNCLLGWPEGDATPLRDRLVVVLERRRRDGRRFDTPLDSVCIGRHVPGHIGSNASRHAVLPACLARECIEATLLAGAPVILPGIGEDVRQVRYLPDFIGPMATASTPPVVLGTSPTWNARKYDRHAFESIFARESDPWHYTTPYEVSKYQ